MNTELLRKVEKRLLKQPARFNMRYFGAVALGINSLRDMLTVPVCKTQACIAGETLLAAGLDKIDKKNGGFVNGVDIAERAQEALGLNYDQAERLFYFQEWSSGGRGWPSQFRNAYDEAKTPAARAKVAVDRIEHFIETEGRE